MCLNYFCFSNHVSNKSLSDWNIEEEKYNSGKQVYVSYSRIVSHLENFTILTISSVQANRGCATVAFFLGGEGGVWAKKGVMFRGLRISEKKEILRKPTVL